MRFHSHLRLSLTSFLFFTWIVASPSAASGDNFDMLSFKAPVGWGKTVVENDHVLFTGYNSSRSAFCQAYVYESLPSSGSPQQDFENSWNFLIRKNFKTGYEGKPEATESGTGWTAIMGKASVPVKKERLLAALISITGFGRVASVLIVTTDISQFTEAVDAFTNSVEPIEQVAKSRSAPPAAPGPQPPKTATAPPAPSAAAAGSRVLFGLWTGIGETSTRSGVTNAAGTGYAVIFTGSRLKKSTVAFLPDGTFCGVFPKAGFDGLDVNAERTSFPYYWGTYTFANGKGSVTISGTSYPFEFKDNKVYYGGVEFGFHYLSPDGVRFAGTFTAEKDPSRYTGPEPTLAFTPDGRFTDGGAIYWMRHVRGSTEDQSDKLLGSGTYAIKNFTMVFSYSDGRQIKMAFESIYGKDPKNPQQIVFGQMPLDRK